MKTPPPSNVAAEPEPLEGRDIMCGRRSRSEGLVLIRRDEATVLPTLEDEDAVGQHID